MAKCPFAAKAEAGAKCPHPLPSDSAAAAAPADEPKCPHLAKKAAAAKEAEASSDGKCPYLAKQAEQEGKCPVDHADPARQAPLDSATDWHEASKDEFKAHFTSAYNHVAAKNTEERSDAVASVLLGMLGYTKAELAVVGADMVRMQGTGNPHPGATIQPGETVVDLGSGFGLDAMIAADKVGKTGRVIGVDLSEGEVTAALKRMTQRRIRNVDFRIGDIEDCPIDDATADCAISNGGFCLVPDKPASFREVFRILKPGGRMSFTCTVRRKPLDADRKWPSCMVVFMPLDEIDAMLTGIGFTDVAVDLSNSRMDVWDDVTKSGSHDAKHEPTTVHSGESAYSWLEKLDMSEYFARVGITARKPAA